MPIINRNNDRFKLGSEALAFAILTLITVLCWVFFATYRAMSQDTIPQITKTQMAPLEPTLKKELLVELQSRLYLPESDLNVVVTPTSTVSADQNNEQD